MGEPERVGKNPTTRRELLKKAAIVGGVVWSMPVIESITTPAYAGSRPCGIFDCSKGDGGGLSVCQCAIGANGFFIQKDDGSCVCGTELFFATSCSVCSKSSSCAPTVNCGVEKPTFICFAEC